VGLTTSPPSRAEYHEIWEPKRRGTLWVTPGKLRESFTFINLPNLYSTYRGFLCKFHNSPIISTLISKLCPKQFFSIKNLSYSPPPSFQKVHTAYTTAPHNHSQHNQASSHDVLTSLVLVLLMMGIMLPETR
jgi:hypothetical protein